MTPKNKLDVVQLQKNVTELETLVDSSRKLLSGRHARLGTITNEESDLQNRLLACTTFEEQKTLQQAIFLARKQGTAIRSEITIANSDLQRLTDALETASSAWIKQNSACTSE